MAVGAGRREGKKECVARRVELVFYRFTHGFRGEGEVLGRQTPAYRSLKLKENKYVKEITRCKQSWKKSMVLY